MEQPEYFSFKNQRKKNLDKKKKYGDKKYKNKYHNSDNPKSNPLINVYNDTKKYFENKVPEKGVLYDITKLPKIVEEPLYNCEIIIRNQDSLDMALDFITEGYSKPLVLNMASDKKSGGGVQSGKIAQEECLFRRTNAFQTHNEEWYPLLHNYVIYSPVLQIIKDSNYDMLEKEKIDNSIISMIAVAALRKPDLVNNEYSDEDKIIMMNKIESIFKIAILNGNTGLVLGALGCGIFKNPPHQVAELFRLAIDKYGKYFKKIGFAILCVKESDKENINAFRKAFNL